MNNTDNYICILIESLKKKIQILDEILALNEKQKAAVTSVRVDEETFEEVFSEKDRLIREMNTIDSGFESVYERVSEDLKGNHSLFEEDIRKLKDLIGTITEKSMEIQLSEQRNKKLIESKFSEERKKMHQNKAINKAATDYYKNMSKINVIEPQFLDKKK